MQSAVMVPVASASSAIKTTPPVPASAAHRSSLRVTTATS